MPLAAWQSMRLKRIIDKLSVRLAPWVAIVRAVLAA